MRGRDKGDFSIFKILNFLKNFYTKSATRELFDYYGIVFK